jgi:hypothetical protein
VLQIHRLGQQEHSSPHQMILTATCAMLGSMAFPRPTAGRSPL